MLNILGDSKEVNEVSKECEKNFKNWLSMSCMSEKDFLLNKDVKDFEILIQYEIEYPEYEFVYIGYKDKGVFQQIGERLCYLKSDKQGFEDLALLLIYMAKKLDDENSKAPVFMRREKFFFGRVKEFIISNDKC